mmetsp:Transcript_11930/g.41863  ORF Transcript_11930/g.41863 Transcript_11930/m.41863 type:complete len:219 (+) Transcript_11930:2534-3190(+)
MTTQSPRVLDAVPPPTTAAAARASLRSVADGPPPPLPGSMTPSDSPASSSPKRVSRSTMGAASVYAQNRAPTETMRSRGRTRKREALPAAACGCDRLGDTSSTARLPKTDAMVPSVGVRVTSQPVPSSVTNVTTRRPWRPTRPSVSTCDRLTARNSGAQELAIAREAAQQAQSATTIRAGQLRRPQGQPPRPPGASPPREQITTDSPPKHTVYRPPPP